MIRSGKASRSAGQDERTPGVKNIYINRPMYCISQTVCENIKKKKEEKKKNLFNETESKKHSVLLILLGLFIFHNKFYLFYFYLSIRESTMTSDERSK